MYLFESHFCTPGAGNEKGRVEDGVGYARRNFMTPLLEAADYADLNEQLRQACEQDDQRRIDRQPQTIGEAWQQEQALLCALPPQPFDCCREVTARLNGYSQVEVDTNRYSVPTDRALAEMRVKLYPFEIKIYRPDEPQAVAVHPRCYGYQQDILEPLHYLPLLAQRPGAFNHAKAIRQWRSSWPEVYEQLLSELQRRQPAGAGVRQFIQVLQLHQHHPAELVEQAVSQALEHHCPHPDGVQLCLRHGANTGHPGSERPSQVSDGRTAAIAPGSLRSSVEGRSEWKPICCLIAILKPFAWPPSASSIARWPKMPPVTIYATISICWLWPNRK